MQKPSSMQHTFAHPAGLRTARHIVRALLESAQRSARDGNNMSAGGGSYSQISHPLFGPNSTVMANLQNILAFREPERMIGDGQGEGREYQVQTQLHSSGFSLGSGEDGSSNGSGQAFGNRDFSAASLPSTHYRQHQRNYNPAIPSSQENENTNLHTTHFATSSASASSSSSPFAKSFPHPTRSSNPSPLHSHLQQPNDLSFEWLDNTRPSSIQPTTHNTKATSIRPASHNTNNYNSAQFNSAHPTNTPSLPPITTSSTSSHTATTQFPASFGFPNLDLPPIDNPPLPLPPSSSTTYQTLPSLVRTSNQASRALGISQNNIKSFLPVNKPHGNNTTFSKQPSSHSHSSGAGSYLRNDFQEISFSPAEGRHLSSLSSPTSGIALTSSKLPQRHSLPSDTRSSSTSTPPIPPISSAPAHFFSQTTFDLASGNFTTTTTKIPLSKMAPRKRKSQDEADVNEKRQKVDKDKKRTVKSTEAKPESAKEQLGQDIWMRILEFTPPSFLKKARLVCRPFKEIVDQFDSIFVNCRKENYGLDMPPPPPGMTERQYSDLLGGKGCQEPGCENKTASRTYWSWSKRWCSNCWENAIEREDRILKTRQNQFSRTTVTKMLECIPVALHDSYVKPTNFAASEVEPRSRGAPRLYKCYLKRDVEQIIREYEDLTPPPYKENPAHTPAEKATALAAHKDLMDALEEKRTAFFAEKKAITDAHMGKVKRVEAAIKNKRLEERKPKDKARKARFELFSRRSLEDLPHIDIEFVKKTKAFKAACRIYRDGGTERGWRALKPKIEAEWDASDEKRLGSGTGSSEVALQNTNTDGGNGADIITMGDSDNEQCLAPNPLVRYLFQRDIQQVYPQQNSSLGGLHNNFNYHYNQQPQAIATLPIPDQLMHQTMRHNHTQPQPSSRPDYGLGSMTFASFEPNYSVTNQMDFSDHNASSLTSSSSTRVPVDSLLRPPTPNF